MPGQENALQETRESFEIHVRIVDHPETEIVLEADIVDGWPGAQHWMSHKARFERTSDFVVGNHDWHCRAVIFGLGDRTEAEFKVRTGGGGACFDENALIKLGELLPLQIPTASAKAK